MLLLKTPNGTSYLLSTI